jgi:hypothetical protein
MNISTIAAMGERRLRTIARPMFAVVGPAKPDVPDQSPAIDCREALTIDDFIV